MKKQAANKFPKQLTTTRALIKFINSPRSSSGLNMKKEKT